MVSSLRKYPVWLKAQHSFFCWQSHATVPAKYITNRVEGTGAGGRRPHKAPTHHPSPGFNKHPPAASALQAAVRRGASEPLGLLILFLIPLGHLWEPNLSHIHSMWKASLKKDFLLQIFTETTASHTKF